jgi:hypothetical protein
VLKQSADEHAFFNSTKKCVMSRGPQSFRKRDVTKAIEAVEAAGLTIVRVEVGKDGKIIIAVGKPLSTDPLEQHGEIIL